MKKLTRIGSFCIVVILLISALGVLSGCNKKDEVYVTDINELNDNKYTITVSAGSSAALDATNAFPNAKITYSNVPDAYLAVSKGTADAFVYGKLYMQYAIASESFDNLTILDGVLNKADIAAGINPRRSDLTEGVNAFIKQIKADGTFDDMYERWVLKADDTMPEIEKAKNPNKTIRFGTSGMVVPMNYYGKNNECIGFDVEFMKRLALFLNADFTIETMWFDSLVVGLQSDRLDIVVSDLNVTEERKEIINFSDPYIISETAVVVRKKPSASNAIADVNQLDGKSIGCLQGSSYIDKVNNLYPNSSVVEYYSHADLIMALKNKRIDAYICDEPMAYNQVKETGGLTILEKMITTDKYAFMLNQNNTELCNEINGAIGELKAQGVLDRLRTKWIKAEEKPTFDDAQPWDKSRGTLKVGLVLEVIPFVYLQDEKIVGYDVELMYLIAEKLGFGVEIVQCDLNALISSITTERNDVAIGSITYTPETAESVLFTDTTYDSGTVAVVLADSNSSKGFFQRLGESFERTFIRENRWKLILNGFLITLELSILTLLFGTLLGFGFSLLIRNKNRIISNIFGVVSKIIDGLPLLIILMVFYYIIFAKTTLSAVAIGIVGLSLDFANSVAGILNTGVNGVDKGQIEAAESLGYPKWKIFMKITLPQATNQMFSQYIVAVISMIKGTSIIGYITVADLTKAGDIIRSLTYEAFFPLLSIAAIYFLLAQGLIFLLQLAAKKIDPKHRKRQVKGVRIHD